MSTLHSAADTDVLLDLVGIDSSMGELIGGKAANLGKLLSLGVNVPPGFCITTNAYDEVVRNLGKPFDELLDQVADNPETSTEIRTMLANVDLPDALADAVSNAYAALGPDVPVAVRSSATAEDLPHASFAGQQDTYLNVIGAPALLDAIRRCWGSLWTDRAVHYRAANGIDHRKVRLAVVVQRMVDAEVAGVLFTANPVTGRRGESVIDANAGLGESVVSGAVNPDHFVVEDGSGTISRQLGDKTTSVRSKAGGGTETVNHEANGQSSLRDDQIRALAGLGRKVEEHYGAPQDIEWAIDAEGAAWLTQSRPITTLYPLPAKTREGLRVYFSFNVAQGVYRPITPMGASVLRLTAAGMIRNVGVPVEDPTTAPGLLREAAGWLLIDITGMARSRVGRRIAPRMLSMMEARSGKVFTALLDDPRLAPQRKSPWPAMRRIAGLLAHTKLPAKVLYTLSRPQRVRAQAFRFAHEIREELATSEATSARERLAAAQSGLVDVTTSRMSRLVPKLFTALALSRLMPSVLGKSVTAEEVQIVLRGIPHNITTDMDLELWGLAQEVRNDPEATRMFVDLSAEELASLHRKQELPTSVHNGLRRFLSRHGHRAVAEIDAGMPRWSEDPTHVLGVVANYVRTAKAGHAADEQYRRGVAEAEAMRDRVVARLRRKNRLHGRIAAFTMNRVRGLVGLREMPKYCLVLGIAHARRQLLAVGADLTSCGLLDDAEDIFFLNLTEAAEAVAGSDHRALVAKRREIHQRELRRRHLPRVVLSDGTEPEATVPVEGADGMLIGTSASAGTVIGPAKVVLDPTGARLEPGEILVVPSTDPGWTPLFLTAGGLVMEMGGPNSHGATVAREYGIPAVVGVPDATQQITNGQHITVNGSAGTVELG